MTAIDLATPRRDRALARIGRADGWLRTFGVGWITPVLRLIAGEPAHAELAQLWRLLACRWPPSWPSCSSGGR